MTNRVGPWLGRIDEVVAIVNATLMSGVPPTSFEEVAATDPGKAHNMIVGAVALLAAIEELGYRIIPPPESKSDDKKN